MIPADSFAQGMWSGVLQAWRADGQISEWEFLNAVGYLHDKKIIQYEDGERNIVVGREGLDLVGDPEFSYKDDGQMSHPVKHIYEHGGALIILDEYGYVSTYMNGKLVSSHYCNYCHFIGGN